MADRSVTARLRLVHTEYTKGLEEAAKKTRDLGDESGKAAKRSAESWQKLGAATADLGKSMTTRVTLPILALGGAAVKMANDFDNIFTQMRATAGVADEEIASLKDEVLGLAGETGQAPKELAEALLLIRSSGFSGAEAMQVLETSAKGAAAGMGTTREIANALTNVISGYGAANIDAAEAMDILTASVTEGKAEAAEMAPQFGRLVPIAAELGVQFDELAGIMAFLTKPTGDAALSATQLSGVLAKMLEPGVEGAEALKAVGMSAEDLRKSIREKGLHQTLIELRQNLEANGMKLNDFAVDQQFLQGALLLTGASAEDAAEIIDNVGDSAGAADEAFEKWGESLGAKNTKAWASAQAAMIQFGDVALPMVAAVAEQVTALIDLFADMPEGVQQVVLVFAGLLAAMGPVLTVSGKIMQVWGALQKMTGVASTFAQTALAAGLLAGALGAVGLALNAAVQKQAATKKRIDDFSDALEQGGRKGRIAAEELLTTGLTAGELGRKLAASGADIGTFTEDMRKGADQAKELQDELQSTAGRGANEWKKALDDAAQSGDKFAQNILEIVDSQKLSREETINLLDNMQDLAGDYARGAEQAKTNAIAQEEVAGAAADAGLAIDEQGNIVDAAALKIDELTSALDELLGRYLSVDDSVRRQNELILGLGEHFDDMREKYKGNALALDNNTAAGIANSDMLDELFKATADTTSAMIEQGSTAEDLQAQWAKDRGELQLVIEKFRDAGMDVSKYDELLGEIDEMVATQITQPGITPATSRGANYRQIMNTIPERRNTHVSTSGLDAAASAVGSMIRLINQVPAYKNVHLNLSLGGLSGNAIGNLISLTGRRAQGGPVRSNRLYEVAENNKHEVFESGGHRYLIPGSDGNVIPMGHVTSAASLGGGAGTVVNLDMRGAVVASERQFRGMVQRAVNDLTRKGRGLNAA